MFRTSSLLGAQNSGFVPFASGGTANGELDEGVVAAGTTSTSPVADPAVEVAVSAAAETNASTWRPSTAWAPPGANRVRFVEAAVLAAVCGYFSLGLLRLVGWL